MPWTWVALYVVLWCVVVLVVTICLGLSRKVQALEAALSQALGDPSGELLPRVGQTLVETVGHALALAAPPGGVVVLFVSATCGPCLTLERELSSTQIKDGQPQIAERLVIVVDSDDSFRDIPALRRVVNNGELRVQAGVRATPAALRISETGMVVEAMASPRASDLVDLTSRAGADVLLNARLVDAAPSEPT